MAAGKRSQAVRPSAPCSGSGQSAVGKHALLGWDVIPLFGINRLDAGANAVLPPNLRQVVGADCRCSSVEAPHCQGRLGQSG